MKISHRIKQTVFSLGALSNMLSIGMSIGYPAVVVPALLEPASDVPADQHQASWLAAITGFSSLIPVFVVGPLMHTYGRRFTNFCLIVPVLLGWIVISFSYTLPVLFLGRFLQTAVSGGIYFYATCIAEFSSPRIRGILLNMKMLAATTGITLVHVLGYFLHWRYLALVGAVPSVISLTIAYFWPETPDWLVSKGRYLDAKTVFFSLRGRNVESEKEIMKLIEERQINSKFYEQPSITDFIKQLRSRALWRPVVLLYCGILLPELGGRVYFPAYSIQLFQQISGDDTKGFLLTYIIDAVSLASTFLSFYFVKKYKRRDLLLYPSYISVVVLAAVSGLLFVRTNYYDSTVIMWITLALLAVYFFVTTCTTFSVSYVIMGELLPLEHRAVGAVINGVLMCVTAVVTMKIMPILKDNLNLHGMFLVFGFCMVISLMYFQYNLPETKDRTLQDIGDYFKGKSPKVSYDKPTNNCDENKIILEK